jgi:DNA-binding HxlR family transcriptional regulator
LQKQELEAGETQYRKSHKNLKSSLVQVDFAACPVETSLGLLGKKWTMAIIRDIGTYGVDRFSDLRRSIPWIPQKVLATRLKQLEKERFLQKRVVKADPARIVRWSLTEEGMDAIRIGMMLGAFGSKWYADRVFCDKRARKMGEVYTRAALEFLLEDLSLPPY